MKTPRPVIALVAAIIAHVAFLMAPDPATLGIKVAWYAAAILGTVMVAWLLLHRLQTCKDQRPHMPAEIVARICETLIFIGAGYSTIIPPGVIKLGGVLPLGWSCAVMALLLEYSGMLGLARGFDCRYSWRFVFGRDRMLVIAVATALQGAVNMLRETVEVPTPRNDDAWYLRVFLSVLLILTFLDFARSVRLLVNPDRTPRAG